MSFDLDRLVADIRLAARDADPAAAVQDVLARAVAEPGALSRALPLTRAEVVPLFVSPDLTILKAVWAPGMSITPHNHLMWAAIGIYAGQEDNRFYRAEPGGLRAAGGRSLRARDAAFLPLDTVHAVANPTGLLTGAVHVYGGDITRRTGRSEWVEGREHPFDFAAGRRLFEEANRRMRAPATAAAAGLP